MRFEIHVTVISDDIEKFKKDCNELNVKPIVIQTQNKADFANQVMTSAKYEADDFTLSLNELLSNLKKLRYNVIRAKVEKQPENSQDPRFIYYESHIRIRLPKNYDKSLLEHLCQNRDFHLSRNLFKRDSDWDYQMITFRTYDAPLFCFKCTIKNMTKALEDLNLQYDKIEIEECIYDSNIHVDDAWLKKDLEISN